ncbi:MAG: hypothetical protein NTZ63_01505 [Candidatus Omnitrophica bacterium]|nr:hypothetical protein [Candidatus Omnitrophota bacterium]
MAIDLKNKKVLITAGPTAVPIDSVRVITNCATGETGILLANSFAKLKAKVTLLLGSALVGNVESSVKIIRFEFFDELSLLLSRLLKKKYDIIIHSAAVSDYRPEFISKTKLNSNSKQMKLVLKRTPKLIESLRKKNAAAFLVGFKFEPDFKDEQLIKKAKLLIKKAKLNLVVANTVSKNKYFAYLVSSIDSSGPLTSKKALVANLIKLAGERAC